MYFCISKWVLIQSQLNVYPLIQKYWDEQIKNFLLNLLFSGDPDLEEAMSPPPLPSTPKETTLDDPATSPPSSVASPKPEEKKKKWKPSMPIFNKKLPKAAPPPEPEPEPEVASSATSSG